jgi:hypothetical protein
MSKKTLGTIVLVMHKRCLMVTDYRDQRGGVGRDYGKLL